MRRRAFLVGSLAVPAASLVADAQPGKAYRIAYLSGGRGPDEWSRSFVEGMRELGYVEGRNLAIESRWAHGRAERFPDLATELVRLEPDVIVTEGTSAA